MHVDWKPSLKHPRIGLPLAAIAVAVALFGSAGVAAAQTQAPAASKQSRQKVAAATATSAPAGAGGDIVARVGEQNVTADELRSAMANLAPEHQAALARDPALLSQTIRMVLANRLVLQEAAAKKWDKQASVAEQLERIRESAIVETYLQSVSTPPESYPADGEIQEAYDANKTAFLVPRQFRIAQIFVASQKDADAAIEQKAKKKLADIQLKLKQPKADFAALAGELSDQKENAANGGEIGWVAEDQIRPEIKNEVMGLDANAVSKPIRLDDGWHIIKLLETKPASTRALDEVRPLLIERLRAQRADALRRAYMARLLEQNPPAINELALGKVFGAGMQ